MCVVIRGKKGGGGRERVRERGESEKVFEGEIE